ncbi:class II fructose-bisphosphate aldolase [Akkermansia muciniphila]|nr:class II fructose-bisphosphate aldolase [Akkermansia muciniphila]
MKPPLQFPHAGRLHASHGGKPQAFRELLKECAELGIVLEIEIGVVGGEEDGVDNSGHPADKLYTSPEDMLMTYEALAPLGKFMLAATFGNVHGVYKPGHVKLKPSILRDGQEAVVAKHGEAARMPLVFHGGSGSELSDIREAVSYGVVKMNIDTDTQYAFTRPIVSHMCEHINGVLKIDGEVGNKKDYDPRSYLAKGEKGVAARLQEAADNLMSAGKTLFGKI